ncbi:arsenate reductase (glutaredoxin) [Kineobactrum sediminis]|uniref:Arsenate reductase n=1 Tax=Kineobactrum sediminis TaxID=1905677 RepID=A0A2N5Y3M8_9GAMM|nr:arsenate reductase (glutaredoxin) [Kineobactrum sediminis]PLW82977.1 arsenate reductase (glutaredoxin) [Kineobactrum sediminis]
MSEYVIYHNPRCSKSRAALALVREHGIEPAVILYLDNPPTVAGLKQLLRKLELSAAQLIRRGEAAYREAGLSTDSTETELLEAMAAEPRLIERPVLVHGDRAVLGRPPEKVLELLR